MGHDWKAHVASRTPARWMKLRILRRDRVAQEYNWQLHRSLDRIKEKHRQRRTIRSAPHERWDCSRRKDNRFLQKTLRSRR